MRLTAEPFRQGGPAFGALAFFAELTDRNQYPKFEARWFDCPEATDAIVFHSLDGTGATYLAHTIAGFEPVAEALDDFDRFVHATGGYEKPDVYKQSGGGEIGRRYVQLRTRIFHAFLRAFGGSSLNYRSHDCGDEVAKASWDQLFEWCFDRPFRPGRELSFPKLLLDSLGHKTNPPHEKTNRNLLPYRAGRPFVLDETAIADTLAQQDHGHDHDHDP
ncbi:MAG: hypothetical protein KC474_09955 [Cyanobacteria bacterium HKST-UBA04]|nr:hypothetical protein [Cyanobacteria bacterium HKST-UBA04]